MRSGRVEIDVDERERRLAQNEALFREVNERVDTPAGRLGPDVYYELTFRISLPLSVYESIRADPQQFVVLPLHYTPEVEDLVIEEGTHWVVRKTGEAGEYVEQLDPRNR